MLNELRIRNFVIIDELTINFKKGLNILTGETGAGKSILIDAISAVLGERMSTDVIRTGFDKATVEAEFDISGQGALLSLLTSAGIEVDENTLVIRRELYSSGKGKCFANAVQIPVGRLKDIADNLLDIHGQNEHQTILKIARHRELLDSFAEHGDKVTEIRLLHETLHDLQERLNSLDIDEREKNRRIEFNTFAINEIEAASLNPGEEEELKNESILLANAEKLFTEINSSNDLLHADGGVLNNLKRIQHSLSAVSDYDTNISNLLEQVNESLYSLEDAASILRGYEQSVDFSPERINEVEERLALISSLKKKYADTIEEILQYAEKCRRELDTISSTDDQKDRLTQEYKAKVQETKEKALSLSESRKASAERLEKAVMKELSDLGMSGTEFRISIKRELSPDGVIEANDKRYVLYPHGLDRVEFLLAANQGEDLRQLRKVASGGEMSRIMLALKNVLLSTDIVDSLIFDEVDTGISGKTAEIVGKKLKTLSKDKQVMIITHLPQIAAMSDRHFSVHKAQTGDRIATTVKQLSRNDKVKEVARMLAGETITKLSMQHAEEMVAHGESI